MTKTMMVRLADNRTISLNITTMQDGAKIAKTLAVQNGCTAHTSTGTMTMMVKLSGKDDAVKEAFAACKAAFSVTPFTVCNVF